MGDFLAAVVFRTRSAVGAPSPRVRWTLALLFLLLVGPGCVQTAMLPARQLDAGETAVSVAIHEPGVLYVPWANGQLTYGLGGSDVSVNLGGSAGAVGGGLAGRAYLSDLVNAEGQVQLAEVINARQGLLQGGLQGVPSEQHPLYVGGRLGLLRGTGVLEEGFGSSGPEGPPHSIPYVGATLGYGRIDLGGAWALQLEVEANVPIPPVAENDDRPLPPSRISIGLFRYSD